MMGQTESDIKSQGVRVADALVFGPLMIYSALDKKPPTWVRVGMLIIGVGTIAYNVHNYLAIQKQADLAGINPNLTPGAGSSSVLPLDSRIVSG
jgi:hypothetical protein